MLNPELEAALNAQLGGELYSSHLYLSMSAYCESANMPGAAHWFRMQEERTHATRFFDHLVDRGAGWHSARSRRRRRSSVRCRRLRAGARDRAQREHRDRPAGHDGDREGRPRRPGLPPQWFVTEQVEEEKQANEVVQTLRAIGDDPATCCSSSTGSSARAGRSPTRADRGSAVSSHRAQEIERTRPHHRGIVVQAEDVERARAVDELLARRAEGVEHAPGVRTRDHVVPRRAEHEHGGRDIREVADGPDAGPGAIWATADTGSSE